MLLDLLWAMVEPIFTGLAWLLPDGGSWSLPSAAPISGRIAQVDSLVPVATPILLALTIIPMFAVFLFIRLVLILWSKLPFT
jgi:hypothetical protein